MGERSKRIFQKDILKILDEEDTVEVEIGEGIIESENRQIREKIGTPSPTNSNKSFIPSEIEESSESEDEDENKKSTWKAKVKRKNEQNSDIKTPKKIQKNSTSLDRDFFGRSYANQSSVFEQSTTSEESEIPNIEPEYR